MRFRQLPDGRVFVPSRGNPPKAPEGYIAEPGNPFMFRPATTVTNEEESLQELYQHLYEDPMLCYGRADMRRCPGVRFYPEYKHYLVDPIFDFGSGTGDTVFFLRKEGYTATGMDQVQLDNGMLVGNICEPFTLDTTHTALCIDVFEHILDVELEGLMKNMAQAKRQVISVHTGPGRERGCKMDLHINRKSFEQWKQFLSTTFEIKEFRQLGKQRGIFFCIPR